MNAIILAGGKGRRLAPLTNHVPKPMLYVASKPMLDYVTSQLYFYGIKSIVYAVGYKKEQIEARVREYEGIDYKISNDIFPLGTAGSVKYAHKFLDDVFVVMSGDCINDINLEKMIQSHKNSRKLVTIATVKREDVSKYGVVEVDENGLVSGFIEKPQYKVKSNLINAGVYIMNKETLEHVPAGFSDFAKDVFPILVQNKEINTFFHDGFWSDIGALEDYYLASFALLNGGFYPFINTNSEMDKVVFCGDFAQDNSVYSKIENTIVGNGVKMERGSSFENCIIMPCSFVGGKHKNQILGNGFCIDVKPSKENMTNYTFLLQ